MKVNRSAKIVEYPESILDIIDGNEVVDIINNSIRLSLLMRPSKTLYRSEEFKLKTVRRSTRLYINFNVNSAISKLFFERCKLIYNTDIGIMKAFFKEHSLEIVVDLVSDYHYDIAKDKEFTY